MDWKLFPEITVLKRFPGFKTVSGKHIRTQPKKAESVRNRTGKTCSQDTTSSAGHRQQEPLRVNTSVKTLACGRNLFTVRRLREIVDPPFKSVKMLHQWIPDHFPELKLCLNSGCIPGPGPVRVTKIKPDSGLLKGPCLCPWTPSITDMSGRPPVRGHISAHSTGFLAQVFHHVVI